MSRILLLGLAAAFAWQAGAVSGQELGSAIPRERHAWGRFPVGSWKRVRILTEDLDAQGRVSSVSTTETLTRLASADERTFELDVEVTLEVAGRRLPSQHTQVSQGYGGESAGQSLAVRSLGGARLAVGERDLESTIREVTFQGSESRRVTRFFFCDNAAPFVLRQESLTTDASGRNTLFETEVEVIALDMPWRVLSEVHEVAVVKTVHRRAEGEVVTVEVVSPDAPGGVVAHSQRETDREGRILRRSTLEVVDYGLEVQEGSGPATARRLFPRLRRRNPR